MANGLLDRLRGARRIELFAAMALVALVILLLFHSTEGDRAAHKTELEARVEGILSQVDGVGPVSVMIAQAQDGRVTGALIVADRLSDIGTYLRVQRSVAALLEVETSQIEIIGRLDVFGGGL